MTQEVFDQMITFAVPNFRMQDAYELQAFFIMLAEEHDLFFDEDIYYWENPAYEQDPTQSLF